MEANVSARQFRTRARIAAHALWDLMARPEAGPGEAPFHAEAITADWVTRVFEDQAPGARAESIRIVGGDDGSSVRRGIQVEWNEAGAGLPTRLFAKSTPTLATRLSAGMAAPLEGRFLLEVRPSLDIEAPVCRWSGRDPDSGRSLHLFDDLTVTRGASFCQVDTVIGREQAERMIDTLATLHGSLRQVAEALSWLNTYEAFFEAGRRSGIQDGHEQALTKAAPVIPARLMARRDDIWPAAARAAESHALQPRTVIHSDVHLGNWYVTGDGGMGLSDWARVCRGLWARDVAYMLTAALSVEDRRAWEMDLIERYLRKSQGFGIAIGREEAMRLYRQQMFPALLMWTPTLCPPPMLPDMQPERMSLAMIGRITAAIDDHQSLDSFEE
ncbi:MAG: aminoglycoside phosphotransferase family protein [Sphingomonadales bacterium]